MRVSKGCMESILDKFLTFCLFLLQTHNTYSICFPEAKVSRLDFLGGTHIVTPRGVTYLIQLEKWLSGPYLLN